MGAYAVNPGNFPTLLPDPHIQTAEGRFAYGFDLDGTVGPDSFEDPDSHQQGVDNQMWRVLGCFDVYHVRRRSCLTTRALCGIPPSTRCPPG